MVMNKASSTNGQFNSNSINNNNGPGNNGHLISNGKSVNNRIYYDHDAERIDQYKASIYVKTTMCFQEKQCDLKMNNENKQNIFGTRCSSVRKRETFRLKI